MKGRPIARVVALAATITMGPLGDALADEPAAESSESCNAAFEAAELRLRPSEGRLLDARTALRACALPSCKSWMVDDCSRRLGEVDARIPSVAFSAEDGRGTPLFDVRVLEGDRELLGRLNGRAVEMDPGPHELVAERGGARVALSVVVIEGKKAQQVVFAFPNANAASDAPEPRREAPPPAYPWARPLAGGLLAGGVVASGVGVVFGAVAIAKKNAANCDAANLCDRPVDSARDAARVSTISFVVGGALAIGSVITFLAFGRSHVQVAAGLNHVSVAAKW